MSRIEDENVKLILDIILFENKTYMTLHKAINGWKYEQIDTIVIYTTGIMQMFMPT